jgi:excisionase family DNA binding protein
MLTIGEVSKKIGVSLDTLRRWDENGKLPANRKKDEGHRYYKKEDVEEYIKNNLKDVFKMARNWVLNESGVEPRLDFYCQDSSVFRARFERFKNELSQIEKIKKIYPLIALIAGEIGDNSYAHNLGNWPDVMGIFFAYDLDKRKIVLADRGQGILTTLKDVKPGLSNHQDALETAFTEFISGRPTPPPGPPRGNGLKSVREVVTDNKLSLFFQTGDAELMIQKGDYSLNIKKSTIYFRGCLALIHF